MTRFISDERRYRLTSSWGFRMRVGQGVVVRAEPQLAEGLLEEPSRPELG
jgi:hypothetical protein